MKAVVVYDSYHGNTKLVAEVIAEELAAGGHTVDLRSVRAKNQAPPRGDLMFLGSPVRMGSVTRHMRDYVRDLDKHSWKNRPLFVFTTILELPEEAKPDRRDSREKYDMAAGGKLIELARAEGLNALDTQLWADVKGNRGPLAETAVEAARQFTRGALASLG